MPAVLLGLGYLLLAAAGAAAWGLALAGSVAVEPRCAAACARSRASPSRALLSRSRRAG